MAHASTSTTRKSFDSKTSTESKPRRKSHKKRRSFERSSVASSTGKSIEEGKVI